MFDKEFINRLTGISELKRDTLVRYYARLPEQLRLQAHAAQTDLIRTYRAKGNYKSELIAEYNYSMFILALRSLKSTETALSTKKRISLTEAKSISKIRVERVRGKHKTKRSKIEDKLMKNFLLLHQLREEEHLSWRDIAIHLGRYHRIEVSFAYLRQLYVKLCAEHVEHP